MGPPLKNDDYVYIYYRVFDRICYLYPDFVIQIVDGVSRIIIINIGIRKINELLWR